jgi:hypothetical protein
MYMYTTTLAFSGARCGAEYAESTTPF